jgi:putative membrane protein
MEKLHPGARWLFRLNGIGIAVFFAIFLGWMIVPLFIAMFALHSSGGAILAVFLSFIVFIIFVIAVAEIYARLAYNNWQFEFTKDNLKLERGIIWKKYSNIPYERVQNIDIQRGIIARMCGFSSVNIQTAGYSFSSRGMPVSEGYIPAVDMQRAEQIREFVIKKIKGKNQGL